MFKKKTTSKKQFKAFDLLYDDLFERIFIYLTDAEDIISASHVCKRWNNLLKRSVHVKANLPLIIKYQNHFQNSKTNQISKWQKIDLSKPLIGSKLKKIENMILEDSGIPNSIRGRLWKLLANRTQESHFVSSYSDLVEMKADAKTEQYIQLDRSRTLPALGVKKEFVESDCAEELLERASKLVNTWKIASSDHNYASGMLWLAIPLLIFLSEKDAFNLFSKFSVNDERRIFFMFTKVDYYPKWEKLSCHLMNLYVKNDNYLNMQLPPILWGAWWVLQFMLSVTFETSFILWDYILCRGDVGSFTIMIACLHILNDKHKLYQLPINDAMMLCNNLDLHRKEFKPDILIKYITKYRISNKEYEKALASTMAQ